MGDGETVGEREREREVEREEDEGRRQRLVLHLVDPVVKLTFVSSSPHSLLNALAPLEEFREEEGEREREREREGERERERALGEWR